MRTARMIRSGEESSIPDLGIDIKWSCRKVVRMNATSDYVVMGLAAAQEGPERDSSYEVLVANAAGVLQKFESVVRIPAKARFAVGSCAVDSTISIARNCAPALAPNSPLNYYVELEGESVADAMKALAADLPYGGFSATAVLGGKAPYDTSTDFRPRDWKVTNAKYSLRRGTTAEVFDIQPQDLDGMIYRDADTGALLPQHRFDPAYRAVFWGRGVRSIEVARWDRLRGSRSAVKGSCE